MDSLKDRINERGIYHFYKAVNNESVADVIAWILEANLANSTANNKLDHLTLMVSSFGGSVYAAFALCDVMEGSKLPVRTVGLGMIESAGLIIFMSGAKGHRILTPNTEILSHQFASYDVGKEHELIAGRKRMDLTSDRILNHVVKHTGLKPKEVRKHLLPPEDVWLTADEARKYGLCDEIRLV